jgi:deazaflavin-dependent oxidoreductase (nitroreductase family)
MRPGAAPGRWRPAILLTRLARLGWPFQVAFFTAHRALLRATGGRAGRSLAGRPVLLLETIGRRTGRVRTAPVIYVRDGAALVVAGSASGRDADPAWVGNLRADPRADVVVDGVRRSVRARPAEADERPRLWAALDQVNSGMFSRYQAITDRPIPVWVLEPATRELPRPDGTPTPSAWSSGDRPEAPLDGRVIVLTGATSGIGLAAAEALARLGASLVLVGRDAALAHGAAVRVARASGNTEVRPVVADLASLRQVHALADDLARLPRLDALVHCAGLWHLRRAVSVDGLEETLAVNHLAAFVLTDRLLPLLRATAGSRVVSVSSHAAYGGRVHWSDPGWERGRYGPYGAYAQTKVLNVLFTRELARRVAARGDGGPLAVAVAPGGVRTKLLHEAGPLLHGFMKLFAVSPARGAETLVWLASAPDLPPDAAGSWYSAGRRMPYPPAARDPEAAVRAWAMSERLLAAATTRPAPSLTVPPAVPRSTTGPDGRPAAVSA